jgi:hypothetical protein
MPQSLRSLPDSLEDFVAAAHAYRSTLAAVKQQQPSSRFSWYPYDIMASIDHSKRCLRDCYPEFLRALRSGSILDIGCADGDLAMFFASLGSTVTAMDNRPTNYNWMAGVHALRERMGMPVDIVERDIDLTWPEPKENFGLTLLFGILYHLKNPYHVLESLAMQSRYCLMSTRVAAVTAKGTEMESEPLTYLLEGGEANNDQTNYWIFSPAALDVLVRRTGWKVLGRAIVSESRRRPEPVRMDRDAREFLFLRSARLSIGAKVTPGEGWSSPEEQGWAWTLKKFSLDVSLDKQEPVRSFSLRFHVPEVVAAQSDVAIACRVNGILLAPKTYKGSGDFVYEGLLAAMELQGLAMHFEFSVQHGYQPPPPETRDLGVIVSLRREIYGVSEPIPFYLD